MEVVDAFSLASLGEVGGWFVFLGGVLVLGRKFQNGSLLTKEQHLRALEAAEKHFLELSTAKRDAWLLSINTLKDSYESRLNTGRELLDDARSNFQTMLDIHRANSSSVTQLARAAQSTERVLVALEEAWKQPVEGGLDDAR